VTGGWVWNLLWELTCLFRRYWGEYLDDVTTERWRQFHDEKLHNWHPSPNICFEVKWVTVKFLGTKAPCTLGWPYTEGTWLYCDYFIWCAYCIVVVLTCFVMCGCFGNMCILFTVFCIVCTVFLYCFVYVYLFLFVLSVLV